MAGLELLSNTVIPAQAGIQEFSPRLPGTLPLPIEGEAKNLVQTKLECGEESVVCPDFSNRLSGIAIVASGGGLQSRFEGPDSNGQSLSDQGLDRQHLDGRAPPVPPCDVKFAEEETLDAYGSR
jgi:hypothetical protein